MHWNFGAYRFDDERGIISTQRDREVIETVLEPKASALLKYFCSNTQRDISRDELIEKVWNGQIVSDNAINRVVVQLRKALSDESKPRQFIATVPKVGYRFISPTRMDKNRPDFIEENLAAHKASTWLWGFAGLFLFSGFLYLLGSNYLKNTRTGSLSVIQSIQPLSREVGWQFDADLSPDSQFLVFSVSEEQGNVLYVQNLENGQMQQVSPDTGQAHGGRWSHDGKYFVYIYHNEDQCSFHRVKIDASGLVTSNDLLQECNLNSDSQFALSLDDEILYFTERSSPFSPYSAYALDMQEQQRWKLAQPLATSYGNHYLDVHPETGKVLLLSEPQPGKSAVYELDIPSNAYKKLHDFDYDLYSAVWGHAEHTVVHPAEHPSYQLLETDVSMGKSKVLISDSRRISTPRRINNGRDYLFASYLYNRDITVEAYTGKDFNSAVMDYLPEYSNAGDRVAFVSKRGGYSKILILDVQSEQLRTLESEDQGLTFYNLSWSPDDSKIAANTSKGILIYDLNTDTQRLLSIHQLTYAVDWYDENRLTYSQYLDGQWQVFLASLIENAVITLDAKAIFVQTDDGVHLNISSGQAVASNGNNYDLSQCSNRYLGRFQSNIKFDDGKVYCPQRDSVGNMIVIEAGQEPQIFSDQYEGVEYYSIVNGMSATASPADMSSDVMRTGR